MVFLEDHFDLGIYYNPMKNELELKNHHFHSKIRSQSKFYITFVSIVLKIVHLLECISNFYFNYDSIIQTFVINVCFSHVFNSCLLVIVGK
jgi:hypothetical protein